MLAVVVSNKLIWGAALCLALWPAEAAGQSRCGSRDTLVEHLKQEFGEARRAFGVRNDGALIEVFASPGGTWTIVVTQPGGPSCMFAAGESWRGRQEPAAAEPEA